MSKRWLVPAIPFAVSLCLSISTIGTHPFWQDSGLYLIAIKELGVLYPPGFVLYEVLAFLWTRVLFFVDFTLAVHLFSSICAALAAGVMALATRDLLRSRGPIFRIASEENGVMAGHCGILVGVLLATGFTFWSASIYGKVYTFFYLILSLLIWRMIRADESGRPRDFTILACLIGLSWQAHPSAVLTGVALILFVVVHRRALGAKGIAGRVGAAAACALGPSIVLLPVLIARDPWLMFGHPKGIREFLAYVTGMRFVAMHGAYGIDPSRVISFFRFLWEDLLGVGLLLAVVGLMRTSHDNKRLVWGISAWLVPYAAVTILFKTEVQHDCWFVAARLPLWLAVGVGAWHLAVRFGPRGSAMLATAGILGVAWSAAVNYRDIVQRDYRLAEEYGRTLIGTVDPESIVLLSGDDSNGLAGYLQRVRGERTDLILVTSSFLNAGQATGDDWYEDSLLHRHPSLRRPDYDGLRARFPGIERKPLATAAFINANAGTRPIFSELLVPPELIDDRLMLVPAGVHWKVMPRGAAPPPDIRYWTFPIEPEAVRPLYRRARGQDIRPTAAGLAVRPERYERRLAALVLMARFRLALALMDHGQFAQVAKLCQSIIDFDDEEFEKNPEIIHLLGISYYAAGRHDKAEPALRRSAEVGVRKESRATALFYLGDIARRRGDSNAAREYVQRALSIPDLDPAYRRRMEEQLRQQ